MPPTKRGIYHNLKESKYTVSDGETVFFFSSRLYMEKFLDGVIEHRNSFLERISKLTPDNALNMGMLADITFYKQIEKRGFRAMVKGVDVSWQDLNRYALRKMTLKNTSEWHETQTPNLKERLKIME